MRRTTTPGSISWATFLDMWARLENSPTLSYRTGLSVVCLLSCCFVLNNNNYHMKNLYNIVDKLSKAVKKLDKKSRGNNYELVYVEKGAQHVGSIGTQIIINGEVLKSDQYEPPVLPECLATDKAMELWKKVIAEGWVDENYQPKISRTLSALLAYHMADKLEIKNKWKTFEQLWQRNDMHGDYNRALTQQQSRDFLDKLKEVLG